MKQILSIIIGIAVTGICLYFALKGTQWHQVQSQFEQANYWLVLPCLIGVIVIYWLKAIRFRWLLLPVKEIPSSQLFGPVMIGFMGNNLLPLHLGELMRVFVISRQQKKPATTILSSLVLERMFDMLSILLLFSTGLFLSEVNDPILKKAALGGGVLAGAFSAVLILYIIWTKHVMSVISWIVHRMFFIPGTLRHKIIELMETGAHGLTALHNPRLVVAIVINSLLQWLLCAWIIQWSLDAFHVNVPFKTSLVVLGATAFGAAAPSVPGYFGTIQLCFKMVLVPLGISEEASFAASMFYQLPSYVMVTGLGLYYLQQTGIRWSEFYQFNKEQHEAHPAEPVIDPATNEI